MKKTLLLLFASVTSLFSFGQKVKNIAFNPVEVSRSAVESNGDLQIDAHSAKFYQFDPSVLSSQLAGIMKRDVDNSGFVARINFPFPDGSMHSFNAKKNNTMSTGLESKFPQINSYDASGVDHVSFVKWDITPKGFHAMIMRPGESTIFIDPVIQGNDQFYIVYEKSQFFTNKFMECGVTDFSAPANNSSEVFKTSYASCELRTYRIAIAATGEYTVFHGGTLADAQAAQVTTMNRVNGVYERDMAITMTIVSDNNNVIYLDAGTDPYTNGSPGAMINECQADIDAEIGSANYDIGHVFGTNSGGLAGLGVVCLTGAKARGVTGSSAPIGDPFDIDYVAHEVGHQFGARHTFNNSCGGNVSTTTAVEPGSGSTIMAYAGICAPNIQNNSDDHFSGKSLEEMGATITAHNCPVTTVLANTPPAINSTNGNVTVPANTPFALTATVTDAEGDPLSYNWEQMDNEITTQPPVATSTGGPNFRSFPSSTDPTRYFPNLTDLANGNPTTWEVVPSVSRTMNFRVTVRDNSSGQGGCSDYQDITLSTDANSGPFLVQVPNATGITYPGGSTQTVTWDVANTDQVPVACANVDILLSTDGGLTYPTVLAANVPNDGTHDVAYPNVNSTTARIMVTCSNRTFFDISDNNFTIDGNGIPGDYTLDATNTSVTACSGQDAIYNINIGQIEGYTDDVNLSVSGLPAGATGTFVSAVVSPGGSAILVISNLSGVTTGNYTFTVTATSTSGTQTMDLNLNINDSGNSNPPTVTPNGNIEICEGGSVALTSSQTTGITWSSGETTSMINVNQSGNYSVTYVDGNGCSATSDLVNVTVTPMPDVSFEAPDIVCANWDDIPLNATPSGGTFFGPAVIGGAFSPQTAGEGSYSITYQYLEGGCDTSVVQVIQVDGCADLAENYFNELKVFPNPTSDILNVQLNGNFQATILDSRGRVVYQMKSIDQIKVDMSRFDSGVYHLEIQANDLRTVIKLINK